MHCKDAIISCKITGKYRKKDFILSFGGVFAHKRVMLLEKFVTLWTQNDYKKKMKNLFLTSILMIALVLSSCTSGSAPKGNSQEEKAVSSVKMRLESNAKLVDYQVVKGQIPIEMMADELKPFRDIVFKARLDYGTCKVRGLEAGMEQALAKIKECQEGIKGIAEEFAKAQTRSEHIFVLATIEEKSAVGKKQSSLIAVLNPRTKEIEKWEPITTPIKNNAVMVVKAMRGTLLDDGADSNQNISSLADAETNPIVKFILKSTPK